MYPTQVYVSHSSLRISLNFKYLTQVYVSHPSLRISLKFTYLTQAYVSHSSLRISLKFTYLTQFPEIEAQEKKHDGAIRGGLLPLCYLQSSIVAIGEIGI